MIGALSKQVQGLLGRIDEEDAKAENDVKVERVGEVSVTAQVGSQKFKVENGSSGSVDVLRALHSTKEDKESTVSATVEMSGKVEVTGEDPRNVSSAVSTTSFFFEQLMRDLENHQFMATKHVDHERRTEEMAEFHFHMTEALKSLATSPQGMIQRGISAQEALELADDFDSIEGILDKGPEEYIAEIRKLMKSSSQKDVNIFFQGLSYTAYVPESQNSDSIRTIGSVLWGMSGGLIAKGVKRICRKPDQASNANDYQRLSDYEEARPGYIPKRILHDLCGKVSHSRLTLVIGPPGCGKTSFLKALAGHLHKEVNLNSKLDGQVRYNDKLVEDLKNLANWSSFVGQTDEHMPLLTVKETLEFAWKCRKQAQHNSPDVYKHLVERHGEEAAKRMYTLSAVEVEFILAVLGLSNCSETIIGNETLKGVSGGERRRVTLGEMLVTGTPVCCLDEISTGLDSAATYDICRYLSSTARFLGKAILVGLLQPPPEVVELFDDVVLLAEGNIIYQGPLSECAGYFKQLGFECPKDRDFGDFLQELPTSSGQRFRIDPDGGAPKNVSEFATAWKQSQMGKALEKTVQKEVEESISEGLASTSMTYDDFPNNSRFSELWLVTSWTWRNKIKNNAQSAAKIVNNLFMGLLYGSLFYQIEDDEWYLKAMLFQTVPGIMQQTSIGDMQELVKTRDIFYKHHAASFYSASSFSLAQFLVNLPYTIFDALVFGNFVYWMCGLAIDPFRWAIYMAVAIIYALSICQMTRWFAYLGHNAEGALVFAVLAVLLFSTFNGSIATSSVIPPYLSWIFWGNPTAWAIRALAINEFKDSKYDTNPCPLNPAVPDCSKPTAICAPKRCGDFYLENRDFATDEFFLYGTFIVLVAYLILFFALTTCALSRVRFAKLYQSKQKDASIGAADDDEEDDEGTNGDSGHYNVLVDQRRESIVLKTSTLVFSDLWYSVDVLDENKKHVSLDLLKGVSGWAKPGRLTALMGSSGAGKSTLLDVLAGRKTQGTTRGHILVNSGPVVLEDFKRMVGYVEQFGIHDKYSTVRESLVFSASLRLPLKDRPKTSQFVEEMMELLELDKISHKVCAALSVEENKKLTIAVEMVANPSVLFADEPTSGLDARGAMIVMRSIQNVARAGRTVISTIHQPSKAVFKMFDDLLLMRKGGKVVFFGEIGENFSNLKNYFQAIPGTKPCPDGYNPATWMLEVIGAGTGGNTSGVDFADVYQRSDLCRQNRRVLRYELLAPDSADAPLPAMEFLSPTQRPLMARTPSLREMVMATAMTKKLDLQKKQVDQKFRGNALRPRYSLFKQMIRLLGRSSTGYWRAPEFSLNRLFVILFVAILNTMVFWQQEYTTAAEVQSRLTVIMYMALLSGLYNMFTIMPFAIDKRALYFRETSSGMYSILAAVLSDGFAEIPYLIIETLIGVNVMYWGIGFSGDISVWLYYSLIFFLYLTLMTYMGLFFAALMPDPLTAQLLAVLMILIIQNFSGVLVPYPKLPSYYKFLYYFSPQTYILEGMYVTQFHDDNTTICNPTGKPLAFPDSMPPEVQQLLTWLLKRFTGGSWVCTATGGIPGDDYLHLTQYITGEAVTASHFILDEFLSGYKYEHVWLDIAVLCAWIVVLRVLTVIVALTVNHNKR